MPTGAHNVDLSLPQLQDVPGTPVTLTFKSYFDIEWDYRQNTPPTANIR